MNISELKVYLENLTGQVTFTYNGKDCGIDPISSDTFDVWCADEITKANSINEVMTGNFFDGNALTDIWKSITDLEFQKISKS